MDNRASSERNWKEKGPRILAATAVTAGSLLLGGELPAQSAEAAPKNPYVALMDKRFGYIYSYMKSLRENRVPGVERPKNIVDAGQEATMLTAEMKQTNSVTHRTGYNQVIIYVRPGQKLPYRIESYNEADSKNFHVGEKYDFKQVMNRAEAGPEVYSISDRFLNAKGKWQSFNTVIGGQDQTPLPAKQMTKAIDNLTGLTQGILDAIGSGLPGA